jgi:hypothetical protein
MVSPRETDRIFYDDTLAWARRTGDAGLVDTLTASGPPPYANVLDYEPALSYEPDVYPYDHGGNSCRGAMRPAAAPSRRSSGSASWTRPGNG